MISKSITETAIGLLDKLLGPDHELVTVITGEESDDDHTEEISKWLEENKQDIAIEVHSGGQPLYPYYFGVE